MLPGVSAGVFMGLFTPRLSPRIFLGSGLALSVELRGVVLAAQSLSATCVTLATTRLRICGQGHRVGRADAVHPTGPPPVHAGW